MTLSELLNPKVIDFFIAASKIGVESYSQVVRRVSGSARDAYLSIDRVVREVATKAEVQPLEMQESFSYFLIEFKKRIEADKSLDAGKTLKEILESLEEKDQEMSLKGLLQMLIERLNFEQVMIARNHFFYHAGRSNMMLNPLSNLRHKIGIDLCKGNEPVGALQSMRDFRLLPAGDFGEAESAFGNLAAAGSSEATAAASSDAPRVNVFRQS